MRTVTATVTGATLLSFLLAASGCHTARPEGPRKDVQLVPPERTETTASEAPGRVPLTVATLDAFLAWASGSGVDDREDVRAEIHAARGKPGILDALFERLDRSYTDDVGKSLIALAVIGELRSEAAAERLFGIVSRPLPESGEVPHGGLSERDLVEMIQAKAVEGLAYLRTEAADEWVLEIVSTHPSSAVRSAAADAYLFNHRDSEEARERLRQHLRDDEIHFLDRVRRQGSADRKAFDEALAGFYARHPELVAAAPGSPAAGAERIAPPETPQGDDDQPAARPRGEEPR